MKQILRLFAVVGVVLLTALISAGSCDKDPDDGNKNTNTNGGSGVTSPIKITPVATVAKVKDKTIYLKASAFPATAAGTAAENFVDYNGAAAGTRAKAFDIEIDKATGGMVVVANGDIAGITDVTTPAAGNAVPAAAAGDKGVHVAITTAAAGTLGAGANIFSVFADKTAAAADTVDAKKAPFAFSAEGSTANDTQPILWCVATITGIKTTAATTTLAGGQKAACYVASVGAKAIGGTANAAVATAWFAKAAPFKREIAVAIAGVRTDATTLDKIGLAGANDAAILGAFNDGVTKAEMKSIVEAAAKNGATTHTGFGTYTIKVVKDADFK